MARQITDSSVLAALAHPLRRRLMDVLKVYGPATVSVLAERTAQRVPNVSHHVRVLETAGLLEAAPELARDRRERWWRLVDPAVRWSTQDFADDPAAAAVAAAAESLNLDRHVGVVRDWYAVGDDERASWQDAAFSTDSWLHLTPDELAELSRQVVELFASWRERPAPATGERAPVLVFAYGVPGAP